MFESSYLQSREGREITSPPTVALIYYKLLTAFLTLTAVSVTTLYILFGRDAMTSIYNGTAEGLLSKVSISAKLPLSYYLNRADWLVVGVILMLFSIFFLLSAYVWPTVFRPIKSYMAKSRVLAFSIASIIILLFTLLPGYIPALNLIRIVVLWLALSLALSVALKTTVSEYFQHTVSISLLFVLSLYVLYVLGYHAEQLGYLFDEDTVAENLQAIFYGFSGLAFLTMFLRQKVKKSKRAIFYLLFSIFLLLVSGEEISWGQRIFKLDTPEFWDRVNVQGEITLHNFKGFDANMGLVIIMLGWAVLLPVLGTWWGWARAKLNKLSMPLMPLTSSLAVIIGLSFYYLNYSNRYADEIWELFVSLAFVFFVFAERFKKQDIADNETLVSESDFIDGDY